MLIQQIGKRVYFLAFVLVFHFMNVQAQESVTGTVTDSKSGETLPGVNILIKHTNTGTSTNLSGNYEFNVPSLQDTLVVTFIGYQSEEIPIRGRNTINIGLKSAILLGEEIVVVGYGTQSKSDLTGSVSAVSPGNLESKSVTSVNDVLQGRLSGVNVRQETGAPGEGFSVSIRGIGSITGDAGPLYVVDGLPLASGTLSTIDTENIESINVLKDASATAIYGARGANGVVIITTKSGNQGPTQITFSSTIGYQKPASFYDMASQEQEIDIVKQALKNSGFDISAYNDPNFPTQNNRWQEIVTRTGFVQKYNLGLSGGDESTTYSVSGTFKDNEGIIKTTYLENYGIRANVSHDFNDRFKITTQLMGNQQYLNAGNASRGGNHGPRASYKVALEAHSYNPFKDLEGNFSGPPTNAFPYYGYSGNPGAQLLDRTRNNKRTRVLGNIKLDFDITNHLMISASGGGDILSGNLYEYVPKYERGINRSEEGNAHESNSRAVSGNALIQLNYKHQIGQYNNIEGQIGATIDQYNTSGVSVSGSGTVDNNLNQLANQTSFSVSSYDVTSGLISQFARINYNYNRRYFLTATVRRDGSSKFAPGNHYGYFPSAAIGWRISNEEFLRGSSAISNLKLRASYGLTGNQNIGNFTYLKRAGQSNYVWGDEVSIGNAPVNLGNPNLKWESSKQLNIGTDIGIINNRVSITADYYNRKSSNLLIRSPVPGTTGISENPTVNIGSLENKGFEFSIESRNITGVFNWSTNLNFSYNQNKVLDIGKNAAGDPRELIGASVNWGHRINKTVAGRPIGAFYMYEFDGIWQLDQAEEAAKYGSKPGEIRLVDNNNNGEIDEGDQTFVGNPHPKYFGGIANTLSYKGLSLTVVFNYAGGYKLFNNVQQLLGRPVAYTRPLAEAADYWTPENPSNTMQSPTQSGPTAHGHTLGQMASTKYLHDASYIRLKDALLSYTLPPSVLGSTRLTVTLSGKNLITMTNYNGLNPQSNLSTSLISAGNDAAPYPLAKIYTLGLKFDF